MKKSLVKATKGTFLYSWAEFAMGRVCNGPRLLWAEFVMGRDVPEPSDSASWEFIINRDQENDVIFYEGVCDMDNIIFDFTFQASKFILLNF